MRRLLIFQIFQNRFPRGFTAQQHHTQRHELAQLMMSLWVALGLLLLPSPSPASEPPYATERDRFSFAQLYVGAESQRQNIDTKPATSGAITIGGLHYWGHADFYVSFPFRARVNGAQYSPGIETGAKYHPLQIRNKRISPYVGAAFAFPTYYPPNAPDQSQLVFPIVAGLVYARYPLLFEIGVKSISDLELDHYESPSEKRTVRADSTSYTIGVKFAADTTRAARSARPDAGLSPGVHPYVGIGPSSAWLTGSTPYIDKNTPSFSPKNNPTIMPDLAAGIVIKGRQSKNGHRTLIQLAYRPMRVERKGFNIDDQYRNDSIGLEIMRAFWDYYGFVPFIGLSLAHNPLEFTRRTKEETHRFKANKTNFGAIFGWDIIPRHQQRRWLLRTTLRYYNDIALEAENGEKINFPNFEFNFIQYVQQF